MLTRDIAAKPDTKPFCFFCPNADHTTEHCPKLDTFGPLEAERAALYAIEEPSPAEWKRLHQLDLILGY